MSRRIIPELYPLYSPSYKKFPPFFHLVCCAHCLDCPDLLANLRFGGNPVDWGESCPAAKKCLFPTIERSPHQIAFFSSSVIFSYSHCCCIICLTLFGKPCLVYWFFSLSPPFDLHFMS